VLSGAFGCFSNCPVAFIKDIRMAFIKESYFAALTAYAGYKIDFD